MNTTSPRRIPRRRDSSRQAAFTFLSNISLGTESYPPKNNHWATAVSSHSVPSPSQPSLKSEKQQQLVKYSDHEVLGNGLQSNNKKKPTISDKPPKKKGRNNVLSKNPKSTDNDDIFDEAPIGVYNEEYDFNKTRGRSNSLREEAENFLTNISLDPKTSKPYHPSREGKIILEDSNGLATILDTDNIDSLSPEGFSKNCRRSSESAYKSDSSSSSANSILNEKSASRKPQRRHPSPNSNPNNLNNSNDRILSRKQNNANSSSMGILSILGYDKKTKQKNRRDQTKQIADLESTKRRKAESFAHLLVPSNSLGPEQNDGNYNPTYLDDPKLKTEKQSANEVQDAKQTKHRTVLSLSGIMGSFMHHNNRPSDLKRESNALFRQLHPDVDQTLTLSQIRKVKLKLVAAATYEDLDLELSTVAKAYVYFEKLILKKVVNKTNRRLYGSICLLLASKVNEPMGTSFSPLLESLHKHLDVTIKDITDNEFSVFAHLDFELYLPTQEFMPHFERLFQALEYNKKEYLGSNPFYEFNLIG